MALRGGRSSCLVYCSTLVGLRLGYIIDLIKSMGSIESIKRIDYLSDVTSAGRFYLKVKPDPDQC